MAQQTVLAVDLGAESGRVMAVHFDGSSLSLPQRDGARDGALHRFANTPVTVRDTLYWDTLALWREVQAGIQKGRDLQPASLGVDTWGVDFALLDEQGQLLGNPVHYRDTRTEGMMEVAFERVPRDEIFARTGIQFMPINTLYQLLSLSSGRLSSGRSPQLEVADTFLTMPDLLTYWLTGARVCEYTIASTTQMLDARSGKWATDILQRLDIPTHIFPEIVPPGTRLGDFDGVPVIAPACHDTGSAVAAVPNVDGQAAYISSGTWSLVGLEVDEPQLGPEALAANVTNEGGVAGTYRLLKNVTGLWILQQCRQTWANAGHDYDYEQLVALARQAPPLRSLLLVDDEGFLPPGDHPQKVRDFCTHTGQPAPQTHGEVVRTILESLALAYRHVLDQLEAVSGRAVEVVHIVGGGSQNELLNQMTADATGRPVLAGPVEATVLGNALVQLIALGELRDIREARQLVAASGHLHRYNPQERDAWQEAYGRYQELAAR